MCIRDRLASVRGAAALGEPLPVPAHQRPGHRVLDRHRRPCLLYTSDAADDLLCVDLGGRRIIKKKNDTILLDQPSHNATHQIAHTEHMR